MKDLFYGFKSVPMVKKVTRVLVTGAVAAILFSGCGSSSQADKETEMTIYYHADDGKYDAEAYHNFMQEERSKGDASSEQPEESERTVITVVAYNDIYGGGSAFKSVVHAFNAKDKHYYVDLVEYEGITELGDLTRRLAMEIGTGGGPDIMSSGVYEADMETIEKGVLEDLTPYLAASGITEEKYFPAYASLVSADDRVYGVALCANQLSRTMIPEKLLGSREVPDIETLVDKLLEYPEKAAFMSRYEDGTRILEYFLGGSEDLWGMVDWEKKTCDFSGELFSKILDVAKRYSDDRERGEELIAEWAADIDGLRDLEAMGMVMVDFYFDDGCHPKLIRSTDTLYMNANSKNKEGAWAFMSFALSIEGQSMQKSTPVHRKAWRTEMEAFLSRLHYPDGTEIELGEEHWEKLEQTYSSARYFPIRAEKILNMIYEEAGGYFSGDKGKEEVIDVIQNRVQLYLNEM